jgi:ribosomal protein L40E
MNIYQNGRYVGVHTNQNHRVCDKCGNRFLSGIIRFERTYSVEAICHRCVADSGERRAQ